MTLLIALALGWRESGVVLLAIPVTLALTLAIFYLYGYTLNRVTLFALIFSIGILVDDAIVVVENIVRHFRLPENRGRPLADVAVEAVDEVGNPTILATFAVIAAILPMAFVRGLMGPYMRPIPVGASSAMMFSLLVAFVVSPWAALRLLRHYADRPESGHEAEGWTTRFYRRLMNPLIRKPGRRWMFLGGVVVLLLAAVAFVPLKWVQVKMLPFDNKSEFQVIIDMPDGTPLEQTTRVAQALGSYLGQQPEVINYQIYAGTSGPYNFNGLVRHYFLRRQPNQADIQVNLLSRQRAQGAKPRDRAEVPPGAGQDCRSIRRAHQGGGSSPGTARAGNTGRGSVRPGLQGPDGTRRKDQKDFPGHAGRGGRRLVRGRSTNQVRHECGSRQGRLARHFRRGSHAHHADRPRAEHRRDLLHDPASREDVPIEVRLSRPDRSGIEDLEI